MAASAELTSFIAGCVMIVSFFAALVFAASGAMQLWFFERDESNEHAAGALGVFAGQFVALLAAGYFHIGELMSIICLATKFVLLFVCIWLGTTAHNKAGRRFATAAALDAVAYGIGVVQFSVVMRFA